MVENKQVFIASDDKLSLTGQSDFDYMVIVRVAANSNFPIRLNSLAVGDKHGKEIFDARFAQIVFVSYSRQLQLFDQLIKNSLRIDQREFTLPQPENNGRHSPQRRYCGAYQNIRVKDRACHCFRRARTS